MSSVNHPKHYNTHPSGVECIDIVESMTFNVGNAVKYLWRAGEKGDAIEDLEKASWYIRREIGRLQSMRPGKKPNLALDRHLHSQDRLDETVVVPGAGVSQGIKDGL